MQYKFFILMITTILTAGCATNTTTNTANNSPENQPVLQTDMQKSSYAQGVQYMNNLQQSKIPLDQDLFVLGMNDALNKAPLRLKPEQLQRGQDWVFVQQLLYNEKVGKENVLKGKVFLDANKQKPGIHTTASGLQYKILTDGNGTKKPTIKDTALIRYRIARLDGEELTSTEKTPNPSEVPLTNLLKGWQEAMLMMTVGSKWQIYVPSSLAYGEAGAPEGKVQQNETLVIDVELVGIKPPSTAKAITKELTAGPNGDIKPSSRW